VNSPRAKDPNATIVESDVVNRPKAFSKISRSDRVWISAAPMLDQ